MTKYCRARISAPTQEEANAISKSLVSQKLVAGTMIYQGNCHYRREGEICEKVYRNIWAFTIDIHQEAIITEVKRLHSDQCPIIAFNEIDGNKEFLEWIEKSVHKE